jgi:folylpolyglutamate synthase/dihydropteroate synthase
MQVLREVCDQQQAELHEIWPLKPGDLPKRMPLFQQRNWYLALSVFEYVSKRDGLSRLNEAQLASTSETYIPARMEILHYKGKTIILDAAHNSQKLSMLARSIKHAYPNQPVACLLSFIRTKQAKVHVNLEALLPSVSHLIVTDFSLETTERFSTDPSKVVEQCEELEFHDWELITGPSEALRALLSREEKMLLITGSFFLLNVVRPFIMGHNDSSNSSD